MIRRRQLHKALPNEDAPAFDDFHDWVLSLPWVVERPYSLGTPGVRSFAVECEPLGRRRLWLLTGLHRELEVGGIGIAVIVPVEAAGAIEGAGWGRSIAPMPVRHVMVTVYGETADRREDIEALALTAYGYAMS
ncbi:MAG: hypothetical protein QOC79_2445 [Actinomycetota bacterium]|nr:hypothetical protein [Actinomycetota bacterium]